MNQFYQLIKRSHLLLTTLCLSFALLSCEGEDGAVGPQGEQGVKGALGDQGVQGEDGKDGKGALVQAGFFEGTITGTRENGTPFVETFKYEYASGNFEAIDDQGYVRLRRRSQASNSAPSIVMDVYVLNKGTENETLGTSYFFLGVEKELDANTLSSLYCYYSAGSNNSSEVELLNYVYNETTGALSFDFAYEGTGENYDNSTGNEITITGKFNSGTGKVYKDIVNRKGN